MLEAENDFPHFFHPKSTDLGPESGGRRLGLGRRRVRGWERKKGGAPVDSPLPRQAGCRGKAAAAVHVTRQARAHVCSARRSSPPWHPCRAAACGAAKSVCRTTRHGERGHLVQIMFSRG
jgi:hypothetical protein